MPIIFNILHWISGLTLISLGYYCLRKSTNKLSLYLCFFLFLLSVWSLSAALAFNVHDMEWKILIARVRQVAIALVPITLLKVIRYFCDYRPLPLFARLALLLIPVLSILSLISPYYELFISHYELKTMMGSQILTFQDGPLFVLHNIQSRLVIIWALVLLVKSVIDQPKIQRRFSWVFFFCTLIPFVIDNLAVTFFPALRYLQIVPVFLTISAISLCIVIPRWQVLDIVPLARNIILDSISDICITLNQKNQLIDFNACARKKLEISEDFIGKNLHSAGFNKFISHIIANLEDGKTNGEFVLHYGNQKEYYNIFIDPIQSNTGLLAGKIVIIKNITEQKNYELQLMQMAEIRTKFIGLIAHDLIGNVASHTLLVESIMDHPSVENDEDLKASLSLLLNSSQNVTKFVEGLLLWSKESIEKLHPEKTMLSLYDIVDHSLLYLNSVSMQKDIGFSIEIAKNTSVLADSNMLQTILRNLISNAIKHSPHNSTIQIKAVEESESLTVSISDEGPGIDEADINQFLGRFHVKSYNGGLGLALCRDFIHLHKGEIKAMNKNPNGTIFSFTLPLS